MPTLTPEQAANIALGVYQLEMNSVEKVAAVLGCAEFFSVSNESRFKGKSGLRQWKPLTGFGYVATGVGPYEGDALIAIRGTAPVQDWLTDGNMAMTGSTIHSGFLGTWNSFAHEIDAFFKGRKVNTIHCIGHSLGGALATIAAWHCVQRGYGQPELYTFGSPRVGLKSFATELTASVGAHRIHRVAHVADPVTMVPLWPYAHVPVGGAGLVFGKSALPINPMAHKMVTSYTPGMQSLSWAALAAGTDSRSTRQRAEDYFAPGGQTRLIYTPSGVISSADAGKLLGYVLQGCEDGVQGALGGASMVGVTVLDQLAIAQDRYVIQKLEEAKALRKQMEDVGIAARISAATVYEVHRQFFKWANEAVVAPVFSAARAATKAASSG
jgi:triacylglycerol lipase